MKKVVLVLTAVIGFGITASAQTMNGMSGGTVWLSVLILIGVVIWVIYKITRGKGEQSRLDEIFQEKGFSNTELIFTKGSLSPTGNFTSMGLEKPTFNILIGVKDGVLSFFGGGYLGMLTIENGTVVLNAKAEIMPVGKIVDAILHPKMDKKIRHLFDIPISDIAEIVPQQKSKDVLILNIYEKSDKRTRLCFHYSKILNSLNIALAKILMDAFAQILETGSISKGKISQINEDVEYALKNGDEEIMRKFFKGIAAVALPLAIVTGVAVSRSGREGFKYD